MYQQIKTKLDQELESFVNQIEKKYSLNKISLILSETLREFLLSGGKRLRPFLLITAFNGFSKKQVPGLYKTALASELLHNFILIHDDIIDNSDLRRQKPSIHEIFRKKISAYKNPRFNEKDLALLAGDILYALAIRTFHSIKVDCRLKQKALLRFTKAGVNTGYGEFKELFWSLETIDKISEKDIYAVYDNKTSLYSFSAPLTSGAILAGAKKGQIDLLHKLGLLLGRAFQIENDIKGLFDKTPGREKNPSDDLMGSKKTLLICKAYKESKTKNKKLIEKTLRKKRIDLTDLFRIQNIVRQTGSLDYAQKKIKDLINDSLGLIDKSGLRNKAQLIEFCKKSLSL
ncbi:MAG: polyprenyl synthetase family protein [Candidatus Omnitrophica bacterium]|nr:polyprenyl synthetase family protein [Candidatus Omnitrophota bacterium]